MEAQRWETLILTEKPSKEKIYYKVCEGKTQTNKDHYSIPHLGEGKELPLNCLLQDKPIDI